MNVLGLILIGLVNGHGNMFQPQVRGNKEYWGYCSRGWGCKTACETPKANAPFNDQFKEKKTFKRGDEIPVEWFRQNHPGGFVRIAFTTFENSDDASAFDSNPVKYVCYETNCREDYHDPMLGVMNGPGSQKCSTTVKIPDNLPDGPVTLQWTWYGGGVLFADQKASFANYVSCSDMIIKGGNPYKEGKSKSEFKGGDVVTSDPKKCRYWSTNSVFGCPNGAEDKDKNGCGYGDAMFGPPLEWENSSIEINNSDAIKETPELEESNKFAEDSVTEPAPVKDSEETTTTEAIPDKEISNSESAPVKESEQSSTTEIPEKNIEDTSESAQIKDSDDIKQESSQAETETFNNAEPISAVESKTELVGEAYEKTNPSVQPMPGLIDAYENERKDPIENSIPSGEAIVSKPLKKCRLRKKSLV